MKQIVIVSTTLLIFCLLFPTQMVAQLREASNEDPLETQETKVEKRLALVIGNAQYADGQQLANAANDATDLGNKLKELGIDVLKVTDASKQKMQTTVDDFGQKSQEL